MTTTNNTTNFISINSSDCHYNKADGCFYLCLNGAATVGDMTVPAAPDSVSRLCDGIRNRTVSSYHSNIKVTSSRTGDSRFYEYGDLYAYNPSYDMFVFHCGSMCLAAEVRVLVAKVQPAHTHGAGCGCSSHQPATLTNRNGDTVTSRMSNADAAARFAEVVPDGNWLWFYIHQAVNQHQDIEAASTTTENVDLGQALEKIGHLMFYAIGRGLKRPRIRAAYKDIRFQLYLSKAGTVCLKAADRREAGKNLWSGERYIGCINKGTFLPAKDWAGKRRELLPAEAEFIANLAGDTVAFLAQCAKDLGTCCYCNHPLDDSDSKAAGYGPVCAKRWGLPYGKELYTEHTRTFTELYADPHVGPVLAGFIRSIMADPNNQLTWDILNNDFLAENGIAPLKKPARTVIMPRI